MNSTMSHENKFAWIQDNKHRIVKINRHWNNSMGIYSDSVTVWNEDTQEVEHFDCGIDFFDSCSFEIDKETSAYQAFIRNVAEKQKKWQSDTRKRELRRLANLFAHHGPFTAGKLALFIIDLNPEIKEGFTRLMKVKNYRSPFRASLCKQVLAWIRTRPKKRKFQFPLSPKQTKCIT